MPCKYINTNIADLKFSHQGKLSYYSHCVHNCVATKEMPEDSEPCSTPGAVRHYEGRIQRWAWLQYCDPNIRQWGWMCGDSWTREFGEVVCRELGYEYDKDVGKSVVHASL